MKMCVLRYRSWMEYVSWNKHDNDDAAEKRLKDAKNDDDDNNADDEENDDDDAEDSDDDNRMPGPISNLHLVVSETDHRLRPNLQENVDFELLPENVWALLLSWYSGGPEILRHVVGESSAREVATR